MRLRCDGCKYFDTDHGRRLKGRSKEPRGLCRIVVPSAECSIPWPVVRASDWCEAHEFKRETVVEREIL